MSAIRLGTAISLRSIQELSAALTTSDEALRKLIDSASLADEEGRLRVWAGNLGALQKGHSSLDYRLRDSPLLQSNVLKLLSELQSNLTEALAVASGSRLPYEKLSVTDDEAQEDDSFYSPDEDGSEDDSPKTELEQRFREIVDIIDNLYKLSVRIRSPTLRSRSLKATSFRPRDPDTGIDLFDQYAIFDLQYTRELLRFLRSQHPDPGDSDGVQLVERLGNAITTRRRQFKYWRRHRDKLAAQPDIEELARKTPHQHSERAEPVLNVQMGFENDVPLMKETVGQGAPKSHLSGTEATHHHQSLDEMVDNKSVTSYATTTYDMKGRGIELPSPPKTAEADKDFECPYCFVICPSRYGKGRPWRTHLLQDLQPYVCTYEECEDGGMLFRSRREWSEHEAEHRKVWRCPEHPNAIFRSQENLKNHLRLEHTTSLLDDQLASIVKVGETSMSDQRQKCPLCFVKADMEGGLQNHIANHLERLAAFALPQDVDDAEDGSGGASSAASRGRSASSQFSKTFSIISHFTDSISDWHEDKRTSSFISDTIAGASPDPDDLGQAIEANPQTANSNVLSAELLDHVPDGSQKRLDVFLSDQEALENPQASTREIQAFGGSEGMRNKEILESRIARIRDRVAQSTGSMEGLPHPPRDSESQADSESDHLKDAAGDFHSIPPAISSIGPAENLLTLAEIPSLELLYESRKDILDDLAKPARPANELYNKKVFFVVYDLTKLKVDAIVNSTNSALRQRSGDTLAAAVHNAAGPELRNQCIRLAPRAIGDAVITDACNLPCRKVIHAIRPWFAGFNHEPPLNQLKSCYQQSLELAADQGIKSVAFPTLGAGGSGFPPRLAARIAVKAVREFLDTPKGNAIDGIIFCVYSKTDEKAYEAALPVWFPPWVEALSENVDSAALLERLGLSLQNSDHVALHEMMMSEASAGRDRLSYDAANLSQLASTPYMPDPPYRWDDLTESSRLGEIVNIFNTSSEQTRQYYVKGLLDSTDDNWVVRCYLWHSFRDRDGHNKHNESILTQISRILPQIEGANQELLVFGNNVQNFEKTIILGAAGIESRLREVLKLFESLDSPIPDLEQQVAADFDLVVTVLQSICGGIHEAFALTAAESGYVRAWDDFNKHLMQTQDLALQNLLELCSDFVAGLDDIVQRNRPKPHNMDAIRESLTERRRFLTGATTGESQAKVFGEVLIAREFESQIAADPQEQAVLDSLQIPTISRLYQLGELDTKPYHLPGSAELNDIICLIQYDITRLAVDVIVNSTDMGFSGMGSLDRAIFSAAGLTMQEDCAQFGVCQQGSARLTQGYLLPCRNVIHVVPPMSGHYERSRHLLRKCYKEVLTLAANIGARSIAFPTIGNGMLNYPRREAALIAMEEVKAHLESLEKAGQQGKSLNKIVFCVYSEDDLPLYKTLIPTIFPPVNLDEGDTTVFPTASKIGPIEIPHNATIRPGGDAAVSVGAPEHTARFEDSLIPKDSRYRTSIEEMLLANFEAHAKDCTTCRDPITTQNANDELCDRGRDFAHEITQGLYSDEALRVRVEVPSTSRLSRNLLLKIIEFTEAKARDQRLLSEIIERERRSGKPRSELSSSASVWVFGDKKVSLETGYLMKDFQNTEHYGEYKLRADEIGKLLWYDDREKRVFLSAVTASFFGSTSDPSGETDDDQHVRYMQSILLSRPIPPKSAIIPDSRPSTPGVSHHNNLRKKKRSGSSNIEPTQLARHTEDRHDTTSQNNSSGSNAHHVEANTAREFHPFDSTGSVDDLDIDTYFEYLDLASTQPAVPQNKLTSPEPGRGLKRASTIDFISRRAAKAPSITPVEAPDPSLPTSKEAPESSRSREVDGSHRAQGNLTQIYTSIRESLESTITRELIEPTEPALHSRCRVQRDRLLAWGVKWGQGLSSTRADIDAPAARAGLTDLIDTTLTKIKDLATDLKNGSSQNEDTMKLLTACIDALYDLLQSRDRVEAESRQSGGGKAIPPAAKWTKIDRKLVNPEALEQAGERFEERIDCVIVLRVLQIQEIRELARQTWEIRKKRVL